MAADAVSKPTTDEKSVKNSSMEISEEDDKHEELANGDKSTVALSQLEEQDEDAVIVEEEEAGDEEDEEDHEEQEDQGEDGVIPTKESVASSDKVGVDDEAKAGDASSESTSDCVVLDSAGDAETTESTPKESNKPMPESSKVEKSKEVSKSSYIKRVTRARSKTVKKILSPISKRTSVRKVAAIKKEGVASALRHRRSVSGESGIKKTVAASKSAKKTPEKKVAEKPEKQEASKEDGNESTNNENIAAAKSNEKKEGEETMETAEAEKIENIEEKVKRFTPSDKTVWVSSLSSKTRATDLKSLFSKHGKVAAAKILTNSKTPGARCYGLLTMQSEKDVAACIKHLHRTELHGRVISVEMASAAKFSLKKPTSTKSLGATVEEEKTDKPAEPEKKEVKVEHPKESEKTKSDSTKSARSRTSSTSRRRSSSKSQAEKADLSKRSEKPPEKPDRDHHRREHRSRSRDRHANDRYRNRTDLRPRLWRSRERERSRSLQRGTNQPFRDRYGNRERIDDREIERKNRLETRRLERERERLKEERDELEREKARVLQMEKEHQRLERQKLELEMEQLRKYSMKLNMTTSHTSKRSLEREHVWDERKRGRMHDRSTSSSLNSTSDRERRDGRHDSTIGRYYDNNSRRQQFHGSSTNDNLDSSSWSHQSTQDQGKYSSGGGMPVMPGIWARMDVPPPPIQQQSEPRWGGMDPPHISHQNAMGHQPPSNPMAPSPNQVVMFVGNNPNNGNGAPVQYPGNRYSSDSMRRY